MSFLGIDFCWAWVDDEGALEFYGIQIGPVAIGITVFV